MKKGFTGIVTLFVGITIAVVLAGQVAMPAATNTNTENFSTGETALWGVVGIAIAAALILLILS